VGARASTHVQKPHPHQDSILGPFSHHISDLVLDVILGVNE